MATPVIMPRQGQSVESCIIGSWHKKVGDKVAVGDVLFSYETDKAVFEAVAEVEGDILALFFAEGDDVPCLTNVCVIGQPGEAVAAFDPRTAEAAAAVLSVPAPTAAVKAEPPPLAPDAPWVGISPRARATAQKHHADLRQATPSGPGGRIIERDIFRLIDEGRFATGAAGKDYADRLAGTGLGGRVCVADVLASAASPSPLPAAADESPLAASEADFHEEKHSHIRKLIGKSMMQSLSSMAQLSYVMSFDATEILAFRARLKAAKENGAAEKLGFTDNITLNDIILYTLSRVVKKHPACNAHYDDDRMVYFHTVNLGMAVDTPRGLMVPTLFNADRLSLPELSRQAKAKAAACQAGSISPDELKDGTITVSNLGALGIESFTPIINPPQTAILGVNCLATRFREVNGAALAYPSMSFSLTCDHRAVDGAPAARFLQDMKQALENFSLFLLR